MPQKNKYKVPTPQAINHLRIALGMTGSIAINNALAEIILIVQDEMLKLGGAYSLRDAARIADYVEKKYKALHEKEFLAEAERIKERRVKEQADADQLKPKKKSKRK